MTVGSGAAEFGYERWLALLVTVGAAAAWEWSSRLGYVSALFFPPPSEIARALVRSANSGELGVHLWATMRRLGLGVALGGFSGLIVGLMMGWSPRLRAFADPFVATLHPIPKLAVLPLIMMVFGLGEASKVMVVALGVFFPMLINAVAGVRQIHAVHFEAAEAYGASRLQILLHVVLPGSLPLVLTGTRLAVNLGLLLTLAVELISAQQGLGKLIWLAWQTMRTEDLYAALFVIAGLGLGFNLLFALAARRYTPWNVERVQ